jgi:hypothetical protein
LLKAREKWVSISYTFMKKWIWKILEDILDFFKAFLTPLFIIIFIYSAFFIFYFSIYLKASITYDFSWLFIFLIVLLSYIWIFFAKNIVIIILNFVFLSFIVIFGIINF